MIAGLGKWREGVRCFGGSLELSQESNVFLWVVQFDLTRFDMLWSRDRLWSIKEG